MSAEQIALVLEDVRPNDHPPSHLIAEAGDRRTLCGLKDAYPHVLVRFAPRHVTGWGMVVCSDCEAKAGGLFGSDAA